jgi:succinoglycan biosynthesis transport protein ExoP
MNPPRKTSSSRGSHEKEPPPLSLDFDYFGRLCLKHWKLLAGGLVLGAVAGYLYTLTQTPIFASRATIVVNAKGNGGAAAVGQQDGVSDDMIKTFEQLLQTKDLSERVVKSQHLNENPEFLPEGAPVPSSEETATSQLAGEVTIRIRPPTRLIDITVEHHSQKMAQELANWLAQESISQEFEQSTGGAAVLSDYLQKEVDRLREKLKASETALKAYEAKNNIVGAVDTPESQTDTRLADLNKQLIDAQAQVTLLEERYGPEHPKLISAKELVAELQAEANKAQAVVVNTSGEDSDYASLKSDVDSDREQLEGMQKELGTAQAESQIEIPGIAIADPATFPYVPVSPSKRKAVALGGFIGLMCGLSFVVGLYFIDGSIRTVSQAESTLGLPVIAAIPIQPDSDDKVSIPTYSDPQSFVAESFRGLRASLILYDRQNPLKTILVGSAIPGEGKSFCAVNLAVAFAQAGLKTLLIDADLRLPTLHTYFNLPTNQDNNGFQDVLTGRATLATAATTSPLPTLKLLLTTSPAESPAELLSGDALPQFLDEAAQKFDRVVIDSAPLNAVSDTMLIMQKADAILLVVRASQTPARECKAALQKISSGKMKPLGLILNYLAPHTLKSYAYGYSYGQKPKEKNAK